MHQALNKIHIIREKNKIKKILNSKTVFKTSNLNFFYLSDTNLEHELSFLVSIPKRRIKLAVHRNYLKRAIKSFIYTKKENILLNLNTNISFIIVYNNSTKIKYAKLGHEILTFLQKFEQ